MRIGVLGANGQVGAEVCLLLRNLPGIELVPIARNRLGSAFLRYSGLPCRHGRIGNHEEAAGLIGDCDVVANFALGAGTLSDARSANRALIRNSITASPPHATIIYFSTISVYPDQRQGSRMRWGSWYGREKLACEALALQTARESARRLFVLRLGHVCGELQNITALIREQIGAGPVRIPDASRQSNTTYTVTIADAIRSLATAADAPGVYDLQNAPSWPWSQVYGYEAARIGTAVAWSVAGDGTPRLSGLFRRVVSRAMDFVNRSPQRKELMMQWIARLSPASNQRIQATYYRKRAAAEIAALGRAEPFMEATEWRPVGQRFLNCLAPTTALLDDARFRIGGAAAAPSWPDDLSLAGPGREERHR